MIARLMICAGLIFGASAKAGYALQAVPTQIDEITSDGTLTAQIRCGRLWFDKDYCASQSQRFCQYQDNREISNFRRSNKHISRTFVFDCVTPEKE